LQPLVGTKRPGALLKQILLDRGKGGSKNLLRKGKKLRLPSQRKEGEKKSRKDSSDCISSP